MFLLTVVRVLFLPSLLSNLLLLTRLRSIRIFIQVPVHWFILLSRTVRKHFIRIIKWRDPRIIIIPTCGSFCSTCCRLHQVVLNTFAGLTETEACSRLWTARRCPDSGVSTRTSLTWTMRPWGELWDTIIREEYWPRWMVRDWSISSLIILPRGKLLKY